jgi:hypothetical protein
MFENKPDQNAQAHLNSLNEYLLLKNVPPALHLAVARQSLKGISVNTWADANWDGMRTFEGFRKALRKWDPGIGEGVLAETWRLSDASHGVTHKFTCPYDEPYYISRLVSPSIFEISDLKGKVKGIFNNGALKKFVTR